MPDTVYTRLNGYQPTGGEVNFGDRLFNGSSGVNPLLRTAAGTLPYVGPAYTAGRGVNALLHFLGRQGLFGSPDQGGPSAGVVGPTQGGAVPTDAGTFAGDPTDPNNPANYQLGGTGGSAPGPASGPAQFSNQPGYNMQGMLSLWNQRFPGSAIGQFAQGNPYSSGGVGMPTRGDRGLGTVQGTVQGLPPMDAMNARLARMQR